MERAAAVCSIGPRLSWLPREATKNRGPDPAHGSGVCPAVIPPVLLPRPGHRSPVKLAAGGREPVRDEGADAEVHCRQNAPLCWWLMAGHPRRSANCGRWCRRSLRPLVRRCQAAAGVVGRDRRSCRSLLRRTSRGSARRDTRSGYRRGTSRSGPKTRRSPSGSSRSTSNSRSTPVPAVNGQLNVLTVTRTSVEDSTTSMSRLHSELLVPVWMAMVWSSTSSYDCTNCTCPGSVRICATTNTATTDSRPSAISASRLMGASPRYGDAQTPPGRAWTGCCMSVK